MELQLLFVEQADDGSNTEACLGFFKPGISYVSRYLIRRFLPQWASARRCAPSWVTGTVCAATAPAMASSTHVDAMSAADEKQTRSSFMASSSGELPFTFSIWANGARTTIGSGA
jgi:hypothetical protein